MTTLINRDVRFGLINGFGSPVTASRIIALGGESRKILLAEIVNGTPVLLGESEDLGGKVLAANGESTPNYHVLTSAGLVRVSDNDNPQVVSSHAFDPGGGRWLAKFGNFIATPLKKGGVQVLNATTGAVVATQLSGMQSSEFAASDSATGRLWVADTLNATVSTFTVSSTSGALTFLGRVNAPNCRDVLKVVADVGEEILFIVCRNRIVRLDIPLDQDTPRSPAPYSMSTVPYTDFIVLEAGKYWIGRASSLEPSPLDLYYGPMLGAWEATTEELSVAAPQSAVWTVSDVVPFYTPDDPPPPPGDDTPPPVIAPTPPVITSALTLDGLFGNPFTYTITATGEGPVTFGVVSPPPWVTSFNALTGVASGTLPAAGTYSITITATNAGGTDTETLVVTSQNFASLLAVGHNGVTEDTVKAGSLLYVLGSFSAVHDASGTYARNRIGCIDLQTGLWTAFNPTVNELVLCGVQDGTWLYIGGRFTVINGSTRNRVARFNLSTGTLDPSWNPGADGTVNCMMHDGSDLWIGGQFAQVSGQPHEYVAKVGSGWRAQHVQAPRPTSYLEADTAGIVGSIIDRGGSILILGGLRIRYYYAPTASNLPFGQSLIQLSKTTGEPQESATGESTSQAIRKAKVINGVVYAGSDFGVSTITNYAFPSQAGNTTTGPFFPVTLGVAISGTTLLSSFRPDFTRYEANNITDVLGVGSNILIGGTFRELSSDPNIRGITLVTPTGARVTTFRGDWLSPVVRVNHLGTLSSNLAVVGGDFGGVSQTFNGVSARGIMFIDPATGARF